MPVSNIPDNKSKVLIVDDSPEIISMLSSVLNVDHHIFAATSAEQAISIISEDNIPDLILLDVMMPTMSGFEFISVLKKNPLTAEIPVIFITSQDELKNEAEGFKLGAVDYIVKPFNPFIVTARVKSHLKYLKKSTESSSEISDDLLKSIIDVLYEVLGQQHPTAFAKSDRMSKILYRIAQDLKLKNPEFYGLTAILSLFGCITLDDSIVAKKIHNQPVTVVEEQKWNMHPTIAKGLLDKIPPLKKMAAVIARQLQSTEALGINKPYEQWTDEQIAVRLLQLTNEYDDYIQRGVTNEKVIQFLLSEATSYDRNLIFALQRAVGEPGKEIRFLKEQIAFTELTVGMKVEEDICNKNGSILVRSGTIITPSILEKLIKFNKTIGLMEPIFIEKVVL